MRMMLADAAENFGSGGLVPLEDGLSLLPELFQVGREGSCLVMTISVQCRLCPHRRLKEDV
jgi:hypothetical protein